MEGKEKLYETFGELIYVLTMADGEVQQEEIDKLEEILKDYPSAAENIRWSFNYELKKQNSLEDLYKKVMDSFQEHGPDEEYQNFIEILAKVAEASAGIVKEEQKVIEGFRDDLVERFKKDIDMI